MNPQLTRPLVVFDLETTGVNSRKDRIVELSAVRMNPDGSEDERTWLLNPGVPIPPETSAIHGYTDEKVKDCPRFEQVADEIAAFFANADLGGFNSDRFDIPCLVEEFARTGRIFNVKNRRRVDVMRIFRHFERRDLSAAVRFYLGREMQDAHHASSDTRATVEVLKAQLDRYPDLPKTPAGIEELVAPSDPMSVDANGTFRWVKGELLVNFGKKKGERLIDLAKNEKGYLKWIVNGDFPPEARAICMNLLDGKGLPECPAEAQPQNFEN